MPGSLLLDVQSVLITLALISPRALMALSTIPGFSMRSTLPRLMRQAISIGVALPAALPTYEYVQRMQPNFFLAGVLAMKEALVGIFLGVILSIPIWVAESIGNIVDTQRSPIQLQSNNVSLDKDASAMGGALLQAVVLVMVQAGLFVALTRIIIESYGVWPAFDLTPPFEQGHLSVLVQRFSEFFWHIVVYGAPILIPLLLIDFGFAMIGVFAPNLQVSFASSPIKSLTGLFILLVYWPTFSHYVAGDFSHTLDFLRELLQAGQRHPR